MKKKKKQDLSFLTFILMLLSAGLVFFLLTLAGNMVSYYIQQSQVTTTQIQSTTINDQVQLLATRQKITEANVFIQVDFEGGHEIGSGTIILVDQEYYYAITNYHNIDGNNNNITSFEITTFDGVSSDFEVLAFSQIQDLALLKFTRENRAIISPLNKSTTTINPSDIVIAIGNPYGYVGMITYGVMQRYTVLNELEITRSVIEHDAILFNGSSGGALVDKNGNLIGINSWELNGLFYAIPITVINTFLENI